MFAYRLGVRGSRGDLKEIIAPGIFLARAIENSGVSSNQVLQAKFCFDWRALTPPLTKKSQLIFLIKLLPYYISGLPAAAEKVYQEYTPVHKLALHTPEALNRNASLSERLTSLRFNPMVLALVSVGEKTGDLSKNLELSISSLQTAIEIENKARGGFVKGLALFGLSILILLGVSAATSESLNSMVAAGLIEDHNLSGHLLMGLGAYSQEWSWTLPLVICGVGAYGYYYFDKASAWWPFSLLRNYQNILRSIRLVNAWLALEKVGLVIEKEKKLLSAVLGSKIAIWLFAQLDTGRTFSELLNQSYFSRTLYECCAKIASNSNSTSRAISLEQISKILVMELDDAGKTISKTFYIIGFIVGITAILLMLTGVLLPIYSTTLGTLGG